MREKMNQSSDQSGREFVAGAPRPLMSEGLYEAQCIKIEHGHSHSNSKKIFLKFNIFNLDPAYDDAILFMAMNDPGRKVSPGTKYYKNWVIANGNKSPARRDRMSSKVFLKGIFEVKVETVKPKFPDGGEMPECFNYSIVRYIKKKLVCEECEYQYHLR